MPAHALDEALLAEFLALLVERFSDAVGVEHQRIAWRKAALLDSAVPLAEQPEHGSGGRQTIERAVAAQDQPGQMPAVGITEAARSAVVFGKEQRGVGALDGVLEEELVHRLQKSPRIFERR